MLTKEIIYGSMGSGGWFHAKYICFKSLLVILRDENLPIREKMYAFSLEIKFLLLNAIDLWPYCSNNIISTSPL